MNYRMISRFEAWILAIEAVFMLPAFFISLGSGAPDRTTLSFLFSIGIVLAAAALFYLFSRGAADSFYVKEGLVCVSAGWILMSFFGCLPFYLSGEIPRFIDALFEMVSGFTTTGSSVLSDVESLSSGILYWRSFAHWVGGMGVLVFLLAVVPMGGREGFTMHLLRAESPGPDVGKLAPKMRQTATVLYVTYIVLTVLNVTFLLLGDMPLLEALCTAFGTAGTGGFGVKNDSLMSYSPYIQNVTTVFMLIFGVNFSCYYLILLRRVRAVLKDEELRLYLGLVGAAILLVFWNTRGLYQSIGETLRHAGFQVAAIVSTTGYATVDFDAWPSFSKAILMVLMVTGACAGSTAGGMKLSRVLLLFKGLKRNLSKILHPQKVQVVRVNDKVIDEKVLSNTNAYLSAYVIILVVSTLMVSLDNFSLMTNFSAVLTCFNNVGPGFEAVGATCNFSAYSVFSKSVLIFDMLAGRLEIFPILVLFGSFPVGKRKRV